MSSNPLHSVEARLATSWPPRAWSDVGVVVALSGGADSVALLRAMCAIRMDGPGRIIAAHFNHQLRAAESDEDEAFVVELCGRLGVPCEVGHGRIEHTQTSGEGLESAARSARYAFLQKTAARLGARYVVTAHTADDQAETILHRILRGTGIAGLSGIAWARPLGPAATLIRPMLGIRRAELLEYLGQLGQPYRSDSSNNDTRFTRNRIRHTLLPMLTEQFNPAVVDALLRLGTLAGEVQAVVDDLRTQLAQQCVRHTDETPSSIAINAAALCEQPRYMIRELLIAVWQTQAWPLQAMGFDEWDLLADMILSPAEPSTTSPQKQTFPGNILAELLDNELFLSGSQ